MPHATRMRIILSPNHICVHVGPQAMFNQFWIIVATPTGPSLPLRCSHLPTGRALWLIIQRKDLHFLGKSIAHNFLQQPTTFSNKPAYKCHLRPPPSISTKCIFVNSLLLNDISANFCLFFYLFFMHSFFFVNYEVIKTTQRQTTLGSHSRSYWRWESMRWKGQDTNSHIWNSSGDNTIEVSNNKNCQSNLNFKCLVHLCIKIIPQTRTRMHKPNIS